MGALKTIQLTNTRQIPLHTVFRLPQNNPPKISKSIFKIHDKVRDKELKLQTGELF